MDIESLEARSGNISKGLEAMKSAWPFVYLEIESRISELTATLISSNDEQVRGKIKALKDIQELPFLLQAEQEGIRAALSEQDAAS